MRFTYNGRSFDSSNMCLESKIETNFSAKEVDTACCVADLAGERKIMGIKTLRTIFGRNLIETKILFEFAQRINWGHIAR